MKKIAALIYISLTSVIILWGAGTQAEPEPQAGTEVEQSTLPIPPLLEGKNMKLVMKEGSLTLPMGTSKTMGFNGDYLGPTIRVSNGDLVNIEVQNTLKEDSTVHWHGLHVPAKFDGGPHQIVEAGSTWNPKFIIDQKAATLWYHPHLLGKTAEQVYNGMAGLFYIEDDYSKNLPIPKDYGIDDFPLVLQDRRLDNKGQFTYNPGMHDVMNGYTGNIVLVNGAYEPYLDLKKGTYRFRVINGSNSSIFRVKFSDERYFTVIASDGGFLPESVETSTLIMSPGERYEILVDFNTTEKVSLITEIYGANSYKSLDFNIQNQEGIYYAHPKSFDYTPINYDESVNIKRNFRMETRGMRGFSINGKSMDMDRIDFTMDKNSTEIWTIENIGMGMMNVPHSFHVHDVQFSVISVNGKKPGPLYSGPKDTVLVMPGEKIVIALRFEDYTGIYMYHCHFLEHEDTGMMGQFLIE